MLQGKKILLGITGSISAYKAAVLCRQLIKEGCEVKVVMTPTAAEFISPLTLSTLSGSETVTSLSDAHTWHNHVELGLWADVFLIAPCTATTISKMSLGLADNILLACYLSAKCPIMIAPAMDLDMWVHPATQKNIATLETYKIKIIPVGNGFLASGLYGDGRMAEPDDIVQAVRTHFSKQMDFAGKKILITAGPTFEAIDPVRFIGNRSSGKMGYAIADACCERGGEVTIVSGPVHVKSKYPDIKTINVESASEMFAATDQLFENADIIVLAAAVADFRPAEISPNKIKKKDASLQLELVKTIDIAATLGKKKSKNQILVGFALETNDELDHATKKLHTKNMDFIVLNSIRDAGAGFQFDTNKITILDTLGNTVHFGLKSKKEVAEDIVNYIANFKNI
jgi:phosphopantothenoylcysteine decarboxylase/phosphopantothenate--cysteine ligase